MEQKNVILLSIGTFFAGALTGGASVYFFMKEQHKKDIEEIVQKKMDNLVTNYQNIGNSEIETNCDIQQNNLPKILKEDRKKFEEEFNSKKEEEVTPFKGKAKERHRRVESLFGDYKQPTKKEKGEPIDFHPEDEEDKKRYYGPNYSGEDNNENSNYPREQDINEGIDETLDYLDDDDSDTNETVTHENKYDDELDDDLRERDEKDFVMPYTITKEEFDDLYNNNTIYEQETLVWYEGNGILVQHDRRIEGCTPDDELIMEDEDKILETIGDATERFGENEDEPNIVYVKNEELCMLYRVIKDEDEYRYLKT